MELDLSKEIDCITILTNIIINNDQVELIKILKLSERNLPSIEMNITNFKNITELILDHNNIRSLPNGCFDNLGKLKKLNLSFNKITLSDDDVFRSLTQLQELNLSFNFLEYFNFNNFFHNNYNIDINLSSNNIKSFQLLESESSNDPKIKINLSFNKITQIARFIEEKLVQKYNLKLILKNNYLTRSDFDFLSKINSGDKIVYDNETVHARPGLCTEIDSFNGEFNFHLDSIEPWNNILMFNVITGKNGIGKSSVLNFIQNEIAKKYVSCKKLFPVLLKMHEKIVSLQTNVNPKEKISKNFRFPVSVLYNLESIIYAVKDQFDSVNQQLKSNRFKYSLKKVYLIQIDNDIKPMSDLSADLKNELENFMKDFVTKRKLRNINNQKLLFDIIYDNSVSFNKYLEREKTKYRLMEKIYCQILDKQIGLENLSPGEQLKLYFYILEYIYGRYECDLKLILLIDEPDAHLHPSAVCELIMILKKICEAGIQVIMTTHNPITVSFINDENLLVLREKDGSISNDANHAGEKIIKFKLENTSKANVISCLTDNLILLNMPKKIIYIEGGNNSVDLKFYEFIKSQLTGMITFRNQLIFMPRGSCSEIRKEVDNLNNAGILNHFGIVDNDNCFDHMKTGQDNVKTFNLLRNSIENYALDPIIFYFFLNYIQDMSDSWNLTLKLSQFENLKSKIQRRLKGYEEANDLDQIKSLNDLIEKRKKMMDYIPCILTTMAEFLLEYLTSFNETNFSYEIFNSEEINVFMLTEFLCLLPEPYDKTFNSVLFYNNFQNQDFDNRIKRYKGKLNDKNKIQADDVIKSVKKSKSLKIFENNLNNKHLKFKLKKLSRGIDNLIKNDQEIETKFWKNRSLFEYLPNDQDTKKNPYLKLKISINSNLDEKFDNFNITDYFKLRLFKYKFENFLIKHLKIDLLRTIMCKIIDTKNQEYFIRYPKIFYRLRGHFLEEVLFKMFFEGDFNKGELCKFVFDFMNRQSAFLIPLEFKNILETIDSFVDERDYEQHMKSNILNKRLELDLYKLCKFPHQQEWDLLYEADENDFSVEKFHQNCDDKANTLTIIQSDMFIFGGYTSQTWTSHVKGYKEDKNAFLFGLICYLDEKKTHTEKHNLWEIIDDAMENAIYCDKEKGPVFGKNDTPDISVNGKFEVESHVGTCYKKNTNDKNKKKDNSLVFIPSSPLKITKIEIHQKKNK